MNIAERLRQTAISRPDQPGVIVPARPNRFWSSTARQISFVQLDRESDLVAAGLVARGIGPGKRMVLMVPPGIEFLTLVFALFKTGAVIVLIDPGMGRRSLLSCLEEAAPDGFVGVPVVQWARWFYRRQFPQAVINVTVPARRSKVLGLAADLRLPHSSPLPICPRQPTDPAAVIFTSGSTGPPKGVLYEHGMFQAQVDLLRDFYKVQPGEVDLPGFPLFALFNAAMSVTTVVPDMNPTRPADVDPRKIRHAIETYGVTQVFGSPAFWNRVGRYCEQEQVTFPQVRRALSAGGPVPEHVLRRVSQALTAPGADLQTPYGATESLPVASIAAWDVLANTIERTRRGEGTCVGRIFPQTEVRIIEITTGAISDIAQAHPLAMGEIGEIIVRSPAVSREYLLRPEATRSAKIPAGDGFWHRIGDAGYLDEEHRLWFCGRVAQVVDTASGRLFTERCEPIFNTHPHVYRSALIGRGTKPNEEPLLIVEPEPGRYPETPTARLQFAMELRELAARFPTTQSIREFEFHRSLPVDTRHNVKIQREQLKSEFARSSKTKNSD